MTAEMSMTVLGDGPYQRLVLGPPSMVAERARAPEGVGPLLTTTLRTYGPSTFCMAMLIQRSKERDYARRQAGGRYHYVIDRRVGYAELQFPFDERQALEAFTLLVETRFGMQSVPLERFPLVVRRTVATATQEIAIALDADPGPFT